MAIDTAPPRLLDPTDREHVVLLDVRGQPCGTAAKSQVHGSDTPLHLAFSCHVVRPDGAVLLTRRALEKRTWPGAWTNGCCGHPQLGETLREAVTRRLGQELGLRPVAMSMALPDFTYRATMVDGVVEHELCPVVVALVDGDPVPDPGEVAEWTWTPWTHLVVRGQQAPASLSPWCVAQIERLATLAPSPSDMLRSGLPSVLLDRPTSPPGRAARDSGGVRRTPAPAGRRALDRVSTPVADLLDGFLTSRAHEVLRLDPSLAEVTGAIRALVDAGGKRLRPAFVYWGHRATGGPHDEQVLRPAAAVELLHTFALLHDDVMDRSATRRGRPSAQVSLAARHEAEGLLGERGWFGTSAAILAGDLAYVWADEMLDSTDLPADALARARRVFSDLRTEVIAGQYLDLRLGSDPAADEQGALHVALLKSARYTVTRPLLLGAALADAAGAASVEPALRTYGDAVGLGFQLRDDILGLFGDPAETGKGCLDDLREGKRTLLMLRALRLAHGPGRDVLRHSLGNPSLDEACADRVRDVVAGCGALASVEALLAAQQELAADALPSIPEPARGALEDLADLAVRRRS
ncbi:MAG: isopentenyl-diphosphate Delta-isomerase [Acidimicrobiales bacterium]